MNTNKDILCIGDIIDKIIYRGNNIFSIVLKTSMNEYSGAINLIDCFMLEDRGIIGGILKSYDIGKLEMKQIFLCQKFNLNQNNYKNIWLEVTKGENEERKEFIAAFSQIVIDGNINLYNPISEDKY